GEGHAPRVNLGVRSKVKGFLAASHRPWRSRPRGPRRPAEPRRYVRAAVPVVGGQQRRSGSLRQRPHPSDPISAHLGERSGQRDEVVASPSHTAVAVPRPRIRMERTDELRKLIGQIFVTLDMVMQAPGGPEEDDSGGFAYGGWSVTYWDEQMGQVMNEATSRPFAMVLGRRTYDIMAAYWPTAPEDAGAKTFNDATKYVASRNRPTLEWSNSVLIEGDAAEGIRARKAEDGPELQVHGSANLIQTLLRHNLVDQYRLWVFPVVIGT